jgi:hypothetical protein
LCVDDLVAASEEIEACEETRHVLKRQKTEPAEADRHLLEVPD